MKIALIDNYASRFAIHIALGVFVKFLVDVTFSLIYRNYLLIRPFDEYIYAIIISFLILETIYRYKNLLDMRISWEKLPFRRFYWQWGGSIIIALVLFNLFRWIYKIVFSNFYYIRLLDEVVMAVAVILAVTAIVIVELSIFLLNKWRFSLAELERFKKENAEFQFESLRSQVNPHFLFNSLNTLSSLIYDDTEKADSFIRKLSDVYRYILDNRGNELVSLQNELETAKSYVYLVQIRFEKNLHVEFKITDDDKKYKIAPLTLQLLIENAVKHNVISRKRPLLIEIISENGYIQVSNNLQKKESKEYSSQLGLKNIQSRYGFLTETRVEIIENGKKFTVKIPLIKK